jgi:urate oxidase
MKLSHNAYGKAGVRVLKVLRNGARHSIKELEVSVILQGNFGASYTENDNSSVVPTDTIKNTVQVLAFKHLGEETEPFGVVLAEHFVTKYAQVESARVTIREKPWKQRTILNAANYWMEDGGVPIVEVTHKKGETTVRSGIEDLLILKTSGSGFEGFAKDELTTLPETKDRILATKLEAIWTYCDKPPSYFHSNGKIIRAILDIFAGTYSPSVQATLYQMGKAALSEAPEIDEITLTLPNKHYLPANLAPFGLKNSNELFIPTNEPYGKIHGTITREG